MAGNYWDKSLRRRVARRRFLAGTSGTALTAAFLVACGGDDDEPGTSPGATGSTGAGSSTGATGGAGGSPGGGSAPSGLVTEARDTTSSATQGGVWPHYVTSEVRTMDPLNNASVGSGINNQAFAYSRMFQWEAAVLSNPVGGAIVPDAAESFETTPDGLTLTFKMRSDMKFDPRPPTNGRAVTTQDVEFSWNRFVEGALTRFDYANELSPAGPVSTIEAVDDTTVVCRLAFPIANMASRFAFHRFLSILPTEADGGFDPQVDQRGSGPWMLRVWEPSVRYVYDRNPDWHVRPGEPFLDTVELTLITEPAQRRAQLSPGGLWTVDTGPSGILSTDVLDAKQQTPQLNLYDDGYPWGGPNHISFGFQEPSPFHDERVRRAMSMVIDRDLWISSNYNVDLFESAGLPMETRWNTHFSADDPTFWIDPKGTGLGEGAAFFQFNVEEATKLMRAAGHDGPLALPGQMPGSGNNQIETLHGMLQESRLFDVALISLTSSDHAATVWNSTGVFEGIALQQNMGVRGDIDQYLSTRWSPGGASGTQSMFPEVFPWYQKAQDLITAQRQELDEDRRMGIIEEIQKEFALIMPTVPYPGAANSFSLAWPHLANYGVFSASSDPQSVYWTRYWYDESKA